MDSVIIKIVQDSPFFTESIDFDLLRSNTKRVPVWTVLLQLPRVRWLHIIGTRESDQLNKLKEIDQQPGLYIANNGEWLLALCLSVEQIQQIFSGCGAELGLLNIRFSKLKTLDISHLTGLHNLRLPHNPALSEIKGLDSAVNLQELDLRSTNYGPTLDLSHMDHLEQLLLGRCSVSRIHLDHDLPRMHVFRAPQSTIYNYDFLTHFPNLIELNLQSISVTQLPQLAGLTNLAYLDVSGSEIQELPPLAHLECLAFLSLHSTRIDSLDDYIFPLRLQYLDISLTPIHRLPNSVAALKDLRRFNAMGLKLETLPDWLPELKLRIGRSMDSEICLYGTTVEDMDDMSIFHQPQEVIRQWFQARAKLRSAGQPTEEAAEEIAKPLNEMKIVFLGDGGAGKTYTITRLLLDGGIPENYDDSATPGIVITDRTYRIGERDIQVHYWDFGGQEILHSMHRMFLTNRTLYVVMLNVRDGTQDERARYWLHNIRSFARESPVLLVLNQMDQNANASINESDLRVMYPGMTDVVKMSAKEDSPADFRSNFIEVLENRIASFGSLESPFLSSWSRLKERLRTMEEPYIRGTQYNTLSEECGVINSEVTRKALLNWFNDLGVSFCYGGSARLEDYVILRPNWITNAIYMILFNKMDEVHNGLVSHETIHRLLQNPSDQIKRVLPGVVYSLEEVEYVLNVVRKFRLSFLVDDHSEFIPMLCDSNSKAVAAEYENNPDTLEFRMEYEYLPGNVLHRLMVELRSDLDKDNVWLTGARFAQKSTGLSAVVKGEGNLLRIFVLAEKSRYTADYYLDQIKDALERINHSMGLEVMSCQIAYKADNIKELFDYNDLLTYLEIGQSQILSRARKKMISILDILRQSDHSVDTERHTLLLRIIRACEKIQNRREYWHATEDERTSYIRDLLQEHYVVMDQTRGGRSELGENAGELDLAIQREGNAAWTILEALNLSGKGASQIDYWNRHLKKLLDNYNPLGLPFLFHVSYVTCARSNFTSLCSTYFEHIRFHSPGAYSLQSVESIKTVQDGYEANQFLQGCRCVYDCGGHPTAVYHIFVRIGE